MTSRSTPAKQDRKADHIAEGYEASRRLAQGSRAARLGDRQQGERRRQEERLGSRQEGKPRCVAQGWPDRWTRLGVATEGCALGIGAQGGSDAQAPRGVSLQAHHAAIAWFDISLMADIWLRRPILRAHSGQ